MSAISAACRACGQTELQLILSLGRTRLANALLTADQLGQPEETYPLDFVFCSACTLAQIIETVAPEKLFCQYFLLFLLFRHLAGERPGHRGRPDRSPLSWQGQSSGGNPQ